MSILTDHLVRVVAREYPQVRLPKVAAFLPMYSLDSGELSTAAAVEIAKITKTHAHDVAARLIANISTEVDAEWRNDNGYIVCSRLPTDMLLSEVQGSIGSALEALSEATSSSDEIAGGVCCLLPDSTEPVYARLRVLARAMIQALLTVVYTRRATVNVVPCGGCTVTSIGEVVDLFRDSVLWVLEREGETRLGIDLPAFAHGAAVWTTHHYHDRLDPQVRRSLACARESSRIRLTMPADGWLLSRDRALSEILGLKSLRRVINAVPGRDGWYRLLFHFASTTPSGDFDPAVALFDESSSPLWNLRVLRARFERFNGWLPMPLSQDVLTELIQKVESYRALILCGLFLPVYTARAILHNEVATWCGVVERLAREGHAFINAPSTRLALERGDLDASAVEIAAGLGFGLSCIVPLVAEE
jgi:hypothetical protein